MAYGGLMFEKNTEQKNFVSEDSNKNTILKSVKMYLDCYNTTVTTSCKLLKIKSFLCVQK